MEVIKGYYESVDVNSIIGEAVMEAIRGFVEGS